VKSRTTCTDDFEKHAYTLEAINAPSSFRIRLSDPWHVRDAWRRLPWAPPWRRSALKRGHPN
jgi:hypothetical protein